MEFFATCSRGFEDICQKEISKYARVEKRKSARVFFSGREELIYELNYVLRTADRIFIMLEDTSFESLDDIYKIGKTIDYTPYILPTQSFAIETVRVGKHDFTSVDVSRVLGQSVIDSYLESKNTRLRVNLDNPDIEIRAYVINNEISMGINTTGESLHKRGYRVFKHPAALKPTIAASLVMLSEWNEDYSLLDPFCGSGTILIEAALMARRIPSSFFRKRPFAFRNFWFFDNEAFSSFKEKINERVREVETKIAGFDVSTRFIEGAIKNAKSALVADNIAFFTDDIKTYPLEERCPDFIISNPPYGIRMGKKKYLIELYRTFIQKLAKLSGVSVFILSGSEYMSLFLDKYGLRYEARPCIIGDVHAKVYQISL